MDALQNLLAVPSWAVEFCPIYLIAAAIVVVINLSALVSLAFMSSAALRILTATTKMSIAGFVVTLILNTVVVGFMGSLQYWICKSALSPKEAFAVKCSSTKNCTDVAGLPQGSACTCGARGVCGSCIFQNNMEPSLFADNDSSIMPYAEGFRARAPFHRSGAKKM